MLLCALLPSVLSSGVASADDTTLTLNNATGTYNGTVNLTATLSSKMPGGVNISFTLRNVFVGNATTNATGVATLTNISLSGISAGTYTSYATGIRANYSGDATYNASGDTATLTINKANQTITFTTDPPASAVYGANFTVVAVAISGLTVKTIQAPEWPLIRAADTL